MHGPNDVPRHTKNGRPETEGRKRDRIVYSQDNFSYFAPGRENGTGSIKAMTR